VGASLIGALALGAGCDDTVTFVGLEVRVLSGSARWALSTPCAQGEGHGGRGPTRTG
jgi:hypothetical protein